MKIDKNLLVSVDTSPTPVNCTSKINWIENMLTIGIPDYRKYIVTFVLAPYFINVKRLSIGESHSSILNWLYSKCDPIKRLDLSKKEFDCKIKYALKSCMQKKHWLPKSLNNIKKEHLMLFKIDYLQHIVRMTL